MERTPKTRVEQWIEDFLSTLLTLETVRLYRPPLYKFSDWLTDRGFTAGDQFHVPKVKDIQEYLLKLLDEEVPLTLRKRALVAIRGWFNFLGREGHIESNPASSIKNHNLGKHLYLPLTEEHVQSVFASIDDKNSSWPARDKTIFETIYEVGLTNQELCALNVADIDWKRPALSVGGTWLPIEKILVNALRIYLAERNAWLVRLKFATPVLFVGIRRPLTVERRLGPHRIEKILKGIDPRISPTKLRDACGIHMLENGAAPRIVAALLRIGINSIDRLREMTSVASRAEVMKSHPRGTLPQTGDTTID